MDSVTSLTFQLLQYNMLPRLPVPRTSSRDSSSTPDPRTIRQTGRLQRRPLTAAAGTCPAAAHPADSAFVVAGRTAVGGSPAGMGLASHSLAGHRLVEVPEGGLRTRGAAAALRGPRYMLIECYLAIATALRWCGAAWC